MEITEDFLSEALQTLRQEILSSLHVAMPGIVESFSSDSGTACIRPAFFRRDVSGALSVPPILQDVPVYLPDLSRKISPGESCLVIFADFCIDGWYLSGVPTLPPSSRTHDLSDAFAFVGFHPMNHG